MLTSQMSRGMAAVLSVLLTAAPGWAWGSGGHRLVALIAAQNLSSEARQKLAAILQTDDAGLDAAMADAATWPDQINKGATGTSAWHFIDVPVTEPFSITGLCPQHDCVIDRIKEMSDRLGQNQTGFRLKTLLSPPHPIAWQEVSFLIHFIGDIHQPLHAATDGDRGGNCVNLTTPIGHKNGSTTELHAVWDNDEVFAVFQHLANADPSSASEDTTASALFQSYKKAGRGGWEKATVEDWARESNDLARKDVYTKLQLPDRTAAPGQCAAGIAPVNVDQTYLSDNEPDTEQQLMRAGIRLSNILNQICKGNGCQATPTGGKQMKQPSPGRPPKKAAWEQERPVRNSDLIGIIRSYMFQAALTTYDRER